MEMKMADVADDDMVDGTCENCGAETAIFPDNNKRCEDCDGRFYFCSICQEEQHEDDLCRHIFQDEHFEWRGSGVGVPECDRDLAALKNAIFKLLELMPEGFGPDLRTAIAAGAFHTWLIAPIIGGGGLLELHGMPDRDGKSMLFHWGDALLELGGSDDAKEAADGYRWLVSLYDDKTPEVNAATVSWVDEWLAREPAALLSAVS